MKIQIQVEETLTYQHSITIKVENELNEDKLNDVLDKAQAYSESLEDVADFLESAHYNVVGICQSQSSSPNDVEIEITDYDIA